MYRIISFMEKSTQTNGKSFLEMNNLVVDYSDGDVSIYDNVKNLKEISPLKPLVNLVVMCTSGSMKMVIGGRTSVVKTNDVMFCPSSVCIDDYNLTSDFECKMLCMSDRIIQTLLHDKYLVWNDAVYMSQLNVVSMSEVCKEEFSFYYALIHSKIKNRRKNSNEIMHALIRSLLLELCNIIESTQPNYDDERKQSQGLMLFNRFIRIVAASEVKRQPITHYAGMLAITPKYLTMLCLKYSNKTASDWIVQYTKEDIRFYLRNSNLSIKEVSARLGFANMSHFGSYVRKHLGASPSDFRRGW